MTTTRVTRERAAISDEELATLALAANLDEELSPDAVSIWEATEPDALLPQWYMPATAGVHVIHDWRRWAVIAIIISFLVIDAFGLCNTYGYVAFG